ncbi:MAG: hypothetical protein FWG61_07900 [Firmicutes bacterium]|nr:hypothetical protein [Bacillota bacterium]
MGGPGIVGANSTGPTYVPDLKPLASKNAYSLRIVNMNCGDVSVRPFLPLRKGMYEKVSSEWKISNPSEKTVWGFVGNGDVNNFKVRAQFEFVNSYGNNVSVKAEILPWYAPLLYDNDNKVSAATKPKALGISNEVTVFRDRQYPKKTNMATFSFKSFNINGFSKQNLLFSWMYKDIHGDWVKMGNVIATVYFIPSNPNLPWVIVKADSNQNPWTDALDMVLNWQVKGMSDTKEISKKITKYLYNSINFKYDVIQFDSRGKPTGEGSGRSLYSGYGFFECSQFIKDVNDKKEILGNCSDCATIVSTFANLLGSDLYQVRFEGRGGFKCNKIKSIGYDSIWQYPFPKNSKGDYIPVTNTKDAVSGAFGYHEIAFDGDVKYTDKIFDACLKVNKDVLKGSYNELLPLDMQFALFNDGEYDTKNNSLIPSRDKDRIQYREMLVLDDKGNLCNATITTGSKQRRFIL